MKLGHAVRLLFIITWTRNDVVGGCHIGGLHKRATGSTQDQNLVRSRFESCLGTKTGKRWNGPVDFVVLHSSWYTQAAAVCTPDTNSDTVECWLQQANLLVGRQSPNLQRLKECMVEYSNNQTSGNYQGTLFPSNETISPDDNTLCPNVTLQEFETEFSTFYENDLADSSDQTFTELDRLLNVVQQDFICSNCSCTELSNNLGTLEEYEYTSGLECGQCWATRVATMAAGISPIVDTLSLSALKTSRLRPRNTCPTQTADLNNPMELLALTDPRITCESSKVVINLHRCALVAMGLRFLEELVITQPEGPIVAGSLLETCIPFFRTNGNKADIVYEMKGDLTQCGATLGVNATHLSYTYTIRSFEENAHLSSTVRHTSDIRMNVTCAYPRNFTLRSDGLQAIRSSVRVDAGSQVGVFDVTVTLYENSEFTMVFPINARVTVPATIYVDISVETSLDNLLLTADSCWISNNESATGSGPFTDIYSQGCPISSDTSEVEITPINGKTQQIRFSFLSFTWVQPMSEQKLFLHCHVSICQISDSNPDCQEPICNKRRKRSYDQLDHERLEQVVTVGPLFLRMEKLNSDIDCSRNNGGCSHICATRRHQMAACMCPDEMQLGDDARTCRESRSAEERTNESGEMMSLIGLVIIVVTVAAVLVCRR